MVADGKVQGEPGTPDRGGARSIDLADEKDRGLVRRLITRNPRWKLPEADKDEYMTTLREAGRVARAHLSDPDSSLDAAKTASSIVKTAAMIEGQNQKDEHEDRQDERERLAIDKPDAPTIIVIQAPPRARLE